jgi:hypothetical protein
MVVPFAAAGPNDIIARVLGQWLTERLGQPFIIENRPGAASNLGTEAVVNAPPDGYTVLVVSSPHAINATLYDKLHFDFRRDIAPVAAIMRIPNVMVVDRTFPARSVPDFISYAKANPDKLNFASSGVGASNHMSGELFKIMTGIAMTHVPYRSSGPALTDLIGGRVQVMFDAITSTIEHIKADRLRSLAVTSPPRSALIPDTADERFRPRLRRQQLVRAWHAQPFARRGHRQTQCGRERRLGGSRIEGAGRGHGRKPVARLALGVRQAHRRGNRKVGQGHPHRQHQARLMGTVSPAQMPNCCNAAAEINEPPLPTRASEAGLGRPRAPSTTATASREF